MASAQSPQSVGQFRQNSPWLGLHRVSPQQGPQSPGQLAHVSAPLQAALPQVPGQAPQSCGQAVQVSPRRGSQKPSPQQLSWQSAGQVTQVSPWLFSQVPLPQQAGQSWGQSTQDSVL